MHRARRSSFPILRRSYAARPKQPNAGLRAVHRISKHHQQCSCPIFSRPRQTQARERISKTRRSEGNEGRKRLTLALLHVASAAWARPHVGPRSVSCIRHLPDLWLAVRRLKDELEKHRRQSMQSTDSVETGNPGAEQAYYLQRHASPAGRPHLFETGHFITFLTCRMQTRAFAPNPMVPQILPFGAIPQLPRPRPSS